ncbi:MULTISPECIES: N-acetylmuramoyl-L-alanine amidase [Streptomyces]|uniref:N-acetylmuramoyl-L-alanine amidase n=1 Tax=Streptomyces TaxID=1883 RepID=UPI001C8D18B0|nr:MULTISPECIES: peptidoglycan recognition family protein [Streptomyces]UBI36703.1 N-acetylmuramoyl-L-alanine amidase [Streptomyces mobaraensis]UKW29295.1 N-acetylmuramoyl-L-alanine amidase [Streptomyces sp. TYQ1024]
MDAEPLNDEPLHDEPLDASPSEDAPGPGPVDAPGPGPAGVRRRRALGGAATLLGAAALGAATAFSVGRPAASAASRPPESYPPTHWIPASSANYTVSARPGSYPVEYLVIHVTQETFPDTVKIFQDPKSKVSAHYAVASADGYTAQFVRERDIAWHAGNWDYNTRSIGIEHEGWIDRPEYFTDALYRASARLAAAVCARYGIPADRDHIIGHVEVPGSTHTDPGPYWDWDRYLGLVTGHLPAGGAGRPPAGG